MTLLFLVISAAYFLWPASPVNNVSAPDSGDLSQQHSMPRETSTRYEGARSSLSQNESALKDDEQQQKRSDTAKRLFGPMWRGALTVGERFSASYDKALEGEPFAVFELLDVLQDCQMNQGLNSSRDIESIFFNLEPSPVADAIREVVEFHLEECAAVWGKVPGEGMSFWDFRDSLVAKAAERGSATAQLMKMERERLLDLARHATDEDRTPIGSSNLPEISQLLNEALRSKDHRAFRQARSLLNYFGSGLELQVDFWNHAICKYDSNCDLAMYQARDTHLFTHEIATINEAMSRLDRQLDNGSYIPFEKMFDSPLQLASGQMWFEVQTATQSGTQR